MYIKNLLLFIGGTKELGMYIDILIEACLHPLTMGTASSLL